MQGWLQRPLRSAKGIDHPPRNLRTDKLELTELLIELLIKIDEFEAPKKCQNGAGEGGRSRSQSNAAPMNSEE